MTEVLNKAELMERVGDDLEFLAETFELLDEDAVPLLKDLHSAIGQGNAEKTAQAAHTMKGMIANFAAPAAEEAARRLETMGREADLSGSAEALVTLESEVEKLKTALQEVIKAG